MVKFLVVGDPHGNKKIFDIEVGKDIDAVIVTGDLGKSDLMREYHFRYSIKEKDWRDTVGKKEIESTYMELINSSRDVIEHFSSKPTFFVFGNLRGIRTDNINMIEREYGLSLPRFEDMIKDLKNIKNISLKVVDFHGIKIAGVPFFSSIDWMKEFSVSNKTMLEHARREEPPARRFLEELPKMDVLLTHIPPYGFLDRVSSEHVPKDWLGKHAGDRSVLEYIEKNKPRMVVCGHIHEGKGEAMIGITRVINAGVDGDHRVVEI